MGDIQRLLEIAVLDALGLDNSIARVRALVSASLAAAKLLEVGDLEERLVAMETALGPRAVPSAGRAAGEPGRTAEEAGAGPLGLRARAVLILRAWKAKETEDPLWRHTMPQAQVPEFNRCVNLMNVCNMQIALMITVIEKEVEKLELRSA